MKKIAGLLALLIPLLLLQGCTSDATDAAEEAVTLWVLTEQSNSDGMNLQAEMVAERLEQTVPGLEIEIEILPGPGEARDIRLKQLRTQIMSGQGPDIYLLPTGLELVCDTPERDKNTLLDSVLFADVYQAMESGVFMDISPYYQEDPALDETIMDAGCMGESRYVLPLRYDIPVIYTRSDLCEAYGITEEMLSGDFLTLAEYVLSLEDASTAAIGLKFPENVETIGIPFDYENRQLRITREQLADYLTLYQAQQQTAKASTIEWISKYEVQRRMRDFESYYPELEFSEALFDDKFRKMPFWPEKGEYYYEFFSLFYAYIEYRTHWSICGIPLYTGSLSDIMENKAVAYFTEYPLEVYPIRTAEGEVNAEIAYWGAVGSSCERPEIACAFLQQLLSEEFQWDLYRPRIEKPGKGWNMSPEPQEMGMVEDSLPVRREGCVEPLWDNMRYQNYYIGTGSMIPYETKRIGRNFNRLTLTREDMPELNWDIDNAYFPVSMERQEGMAAYMDRLNEADGSPTDESIEELAEKLYMNLQWHLGEG